MTEQDAADLETAETLVADGKALRRRVLGRLRARAFRSKDHD